MIHGRLDYCNSVLYGMLAANLNKLQQVQNSAVRTVTRTRCFDHATPILADLHWLPVKYRIQYKVAVTIYKILTTQEPSYLTDIIRLHVPSRQLRFCNRNLLQKDRTNLVFTDRLFSQAAPTVWNNLPHHVISDLSNLTLFKRLLKRELYKRTYHCWSLTDPALAILHLVNDSTCVNNCIIIIVRFSGNDCESFLLQLLCVVVQRLNSIL